SRTAMKLQPIREHFLPGNEGDPRFIDYLRRLSFPGLQTVAAVEFGVPILLFVGRWAAAPETMNTTPLLQSVAMMVTRLITLAISRSGRSRRHGEGLGAVSAWHAIALLRWVAVWSAVTAADADDYSLAAITLVVVATISTVPFLPWHALAFGVSIELMYAFACFSATRSGLPPQDHVNAHHVFLIALALLPTAIPPTNHPHPKHDHHATHASI